jgi:hypothetical protein
MSMILCGIGMRRRALGWSRARALPSATRSTSVSFNDVPSRVMFVFMARGV